MAFEVATYTDVIAKDSIDGVDGFNFQSVSPGITGVDLQCIRQNLLHRIVPTWALENDPLEHPATCAYVVRGGRSLLARGESTGDTNSGRPGNQITQAIVTADPDDFVPYRPAQLFGAVEWTLERAPSTSSDSWITPLEIRPEFEVEALEALVTADDWAREVLPRYLTMVDAATGVDRKKLVLIHGDLDVVMQWIALGTLFVDTETARSLQFRALVDDPWRVDATIVGVSPRFGQVDLGAANVLDLSGRSIPDLEPSESARVRASWFLDHGADDSFTAIEIARRWESGLGTDLAIEAARIVGFPGASITGQPAWRTCMEATVGLAEAELRDELELYTDELCDAAVGYGPSSHDEFGLAARAIRQALNQDVDGLVLGLLIPTLEALTAFPGGIAPFAHELSHSAFAVRWETADSSGAAGAYVGELLDAADDEVLPMLFSAARVIAAPVAETPLNRAVGRLADAWVQNPALGRDTWQSWVAGSSVLTATVQRLVASLRGGNERTLSALLGGEWNFAEKFSGDPQLNGWLKVSALARVPVDDRAKHIARETGFAPEAWQVVMAGSSLPEHSRLWATWITRNGAPADMVETLKATFRSVLNSDPRTVAGSPTGNWPVLMSSLNGISDPVLVALASEFSRAYESFTHMREVVADQPEARLDACLPQLGKLTPFLLPEVGWLLLNSSDSGEVEKLLRAAYPWGPEAVRTSLFALASTADPLRAIEYGLALRKDPAEQIADAADEALAEIFAANPDLMKQTKKQPHLKDELEDHLRERPQELGVVRKLFGSFGRHKEN